MDAISLLSTPILYDIFSYLLETRWCSNLSDNLVYLVLVQVTKKWPVPRRICIFRFRSHAALETCLQKQYFDIRAISLHLTTFHDSWCLQTLKQLSSLQFLHVLSSSSTFDLSEFTQLKSLSIAPISLSIKYPPCIDSLFVLGSAVFYHQISVPSWIKRLVVKFVKTKIFHDLPHSLQYLELESSLVCNMELLTSCVSLSCMQSNLESDCKLPPNLVSFTFVHHTPYNKTELEKVQKMFDSLPNQVHLKIVKVDVGDVDYSFLTKMPFLDHIYVGCEIEYNAIRYYACPHVRVELVSQPIQFNPRFKPFSLL